MIEKIHGSPSTHIRYEAFELNLTPVSQTLFTRLSMIPAGQARIEAQPQSITQTPTQELMLIQLVQTD
ncbi:MAG: hypothetical protein ACOC1P_06495, partial [Minisyncoccales bacterium]